VDRDAWLEGPVICFVGSWKVVEKGWYMYSSFFEGVGDSSLGSAHSGVLRIARSLRKRWDTRSCWDVPIDRDL